MIIIVCSVGYLLLLWALWPRRMAREPSDAAPGVCPVTPCAATAMAGQVESVQEIECPLEDTQRSRRPEMLARWLDSLPEEFLSEEPSEEITIAVDISDLRGAMPAMALEECRTAVGRLVAYRPYPGARLEQGIVTSVGETMVFVRYGADAHSKATRPEDLALVGTSHAHDAACPAQRAQFPPVDVQPGAIGSSEAQLLRDRR